MVLADSSRNPSKCYLSCIDVLSVDGMGPLVSQWTLRIGRKFLSYVERSVFSGGSRTDELVLVPVGGKLGQQVRWTLHLPL
jgi:hypothetical protein